MATHNDDWGIVIAIAGFLVVLALVALYLALTEAARLTVRVGRVNPRLVVGMWLLVGFGIAASLATASPYPASVAAVTWSLVMGICDQLGGGVQLGNEGLLNPWFGTNR